jgi:hypothetical protein
MVTGNLKIIGGDFAIMISGLLYELDHLRICSLGQFVVFVISQYHQAALAREVIPVHSSFLTAKVKTKRTIENLLDCYLPAVHYIQSQIRLTKCLMHLAYL